MVITSNFLQKYVSTVMLIVVVAGLALVVNAVFGLLGWPSDTIGNKDRIVTLAAGTYALGFAALVLFLVRADRIFAD
ncbi:MAG: hypothetical protein Q8P13_00380 [bacterium]|nr:hypothetical protein [bacterium]